MRFIPFLIPMLLISFLILPVGTLPGGMRLHLYGAAAAGRECVSSTVRVGGSADHSLCHYQAGVLGNTVGGAFLFGAPDTEPPVTRITPNIQYISPNNDGVQDYVSFDLEVSDSSRIRGWRLQILDQGENLVTEYRTTDRPVIRNFFSRIFRGSGAVVPDRLIWDGNDQNHRTVQDGIYYFTFNAWDVRDNIAAIKRGTLYVDTTSPRVELTSGECLFSPNRKGRKDTFTVQQRVECAADDEWEASFIDAEGKVVRNFRWTGIEVPKTLSWDGRDDEGRDAAEGLYEYRITSRDRAGNLASASVPEIVLTRQYEYADITLTPTIHSYRRGGEIQFSAFLSSATGLEYWGIAVLNDGKRIVKQINGVDFKKSASWNVMDDDGDRLPDGRYFVNFTALFQHGSMPQSFEKGLIIDSTPPSLGVSHSPGLFSPDGDGVNDVLTIRPGGRDEFGISQWKLSVYTPSGYPFKTFQGRGNIPGEILWDGYGDGGEIVESAADYTIDIEATDEAGNYARSRKDRLHADVLVMDTEHGFRIRVSSIEFVPGSAEFAGSARSVLSRVYSVLGRYRGYRCVVEGHTDDVGTEESNLDISEKRARAVMHYLIDRGLSEKSLSFLGMGETSPQFPNTSEENRRRNRRIEFLLLKE
ncbi:MAG: OmpA family protein [Spirochaetes bacterium]|nr:OmpA family protein [Spirochaetota bacterium]